MDKDISISKIVLDVNGKKIELSLDEAQELEEILGKLFHKETEIITVPQPYPYPVYPYAIWEHIPKPYKKWDITWDTTSIYCTSSTSGSTR
jgi:hypothetical protein